MLSSESLLVCCAYYYQLACALWSKIERSWIVTLCLKWLEQCSVFDYRYGLFGCIWWRVDRFPIAGLLMFLMIILMCMWSRLVQLVVMELLYWSFWLKKVPDRANSSWMCDLKVKKMIFCCWYNYVRNHIVTNNHDFVIF